MDATPSGASGGTPPSGTLDAPTTAGALARARSLAPRDGPALRPEPASRTVLDVEAVSDMALGTDGRVIVGAIAPMPPFTGRPVAPGGRVLALDSGGEIAWALATERAVTSVAAGADGVTAAGESSGRVTLLDARGAPLARHELGARIIGLAPCDDGTFVVTTHDAASGAGAIARLAASGPAWRQPLPRRPSRPSVAGAAFVTTRFTELWCFELDGARRWTAVARPDGHPPGVADDGRVLVTTQGGLAVLRAAGGELEREIALDVLASASALPLAGGGTLVVGTSKESAYRQRLVELGAELTAERTHDLPGGSAYGRPVVTARGDVAMASHEWVWVRPAGGEPWTRPLALGDRGAGDVRQTVPVIVDAAARVWAGEARSVAAFG